MLELHKIHSRLKSKERVFLDSINEMSLFLILIEELLNIDEAQIDIENSSYTQNDMDINLVLVGMKNHCKIYFEVVSPNIVDIQLGSGGEFLFMQEITTIDDSHKFRQAIRDLLTSSIEEKVVCSNGNIASVTYKVLHNIGENNIKQEYSSFFKMTWPWEKKVIKENVYNSWI